MRAQNVKAKSVLTERHPGVFELPTTTWLPWWNGYACGSVFAPKSQAGIRKVMGRRADYMSSEYIYICNNTIGNYLLSTSYGSLEMLHLQRSMTSKVARRV